MRILANKSGFLIEKDIKMFIKKVKYLINNKNIRSSFGKNGREYILSNFNMDKIDEFMINQYSKL